eukprot:g55866.t1
MEWKVRTLLRSRYLPELLINAQNNDFRLFVRKVFEQRNPELTVFHFLQRASPCNLQPVCTAAHLAAFTHTNMLRASLRRLPTRSQQTSTGCKNVGRNFSTRAAGTGLLRTSSRMIASSGMVARSAWALESSAVAVQRRGFASYPDHEILTFPSLSPTMEQGNLPEWGKKEGEQVLPGDTIAMVETDKATLPWDSVEEGYIAKHLVPAGSTDIKCGTPVAIIVSSKEDCAAFADYKVDASATAAAPPAKAAAPAKAPAPAAPAAPAKAAAPAAPAAPKAAAAPAAPAAAAASTGPVRASPYARHIARQRGVDISAMAGGSGLRGMVIASDVLKFTPPAAAPAVAVAAGGAPGEYTDIPHTNMRKVIATRLTQSKTTVPHYYLSIDVCMDKVLATRAQLNKKLEKADKPKLSVNDFVIKATAKALSQVKDMNAAWMDKAIRQYNYVDISVAVSTPTGLITPIVRDADLKGLVDISADVRDLATRARENKLQPAEYQGGTFTISNLGMFGVKNFSAIINPPQAGILAVGGTETRVVPNPKAGQEGQDKFITSHFMSGQDKFITSQFMSVTISADHRVVDGAVGAAWLKAFKQNLEDPLELLL